MSIRKRSAAQQIANRVRNMALDKLPDTPSDSLLRHLTIQAAHETFLEGQSKRQWRKAATVAFWNAWRKRNARTQSP